MKCAVSMWQCGLLVIATAVFVGAFAETAHAEPTADDDSNHKWHFRAEIMPPFAHASMRDGARPWPYSGRAGLGARAPSGFWLEGTGGPILGVEGLGWGAGMLAGATLGQVAPVPSSWTLSAPVFVGYRFMNRPASGATDGHAIFEDLHLAVLGARGAVTRWAAGDNGLELGIELSLGLPFARRTPETDPYYQDGPTHTIIEAGLFVAWLIT